MLKTKVVIKRPNVREKHLPPNEKGQKVYGLAYPTSFKVYIDPRQDSYEYLNTCIHEMLHCFLPDLEEPPIRKLADLMTQEIWARKYRRINKIKKIKLN